MLAYKVFGSGLSTLAVNAIARDVASGLTATGSTRADAYVCTFATNAFSTVAAGTGAILDPNGSQGDAQLIYNGGANVLAVYPPTGAGFNGLAANAPTFLAARSACRFECITSTLWTAILSA